MSGLILPRRHFLGGLGAALIGGKAEASNLLNPFWAAPAAAAAMTFFDRADFFNTTSGSFSYPASIAADDAGLLWVETADQAMPTPTGYTPVNDAASLAVTRGTLFERRLDGTETSLSYGDSGDHQIGQLYIFRGSLWTGGTCVHAIGADANGTAVSGSLPGLTTTVDNCLMVALVAESDFGSDPTAFANSDWASVTTLGGLGNGAGNNGLVKAAYGVKTAAGSVGATTFTPNPSPAWAGCQVALR